MHSPLIPTLSVFLAVVSSNPIARAEGKNSDHITSQKVVETEPAMAPCGLLRKSEIEAVQGEPVIQTKPTESAQGPFTISQCYFALKTNSNSVVLTVTRKGSGEAAEEPKEFWEKKFRHEKGESEEREPEEEHAPPVKIDGIGDDAYWTGNALSGAIYVLSGELFFRLSVGGARDRDENIARSKKLARAVVQRLTKPAGTITK